MNAFIRKFDLIKKFVYRFFQLLKITFVEIIDFEHDDDFEKFLNVIFIDVVVFQQLINFKNKKKKLKRFFFHETFERNNR